MVFGSTGKITADQRGQMPNALRIGLLGPLLLQDETGHAVRVGGRCVPMMRGVLEV